jgi:hypothetical protein
MKAIKLELKEKARLNVVYLLVMFEGGDADTEHPKEYLLEGVTFEDFAKQQDLVQAELDKYRDLKEILDTNGDDMDYSEVVEGYGDEIAQMFDNVPNDPQCDYQFKCHLGHVDIIAYDSKGNKYEARYVV